jgi:DNA primase
MRFPPELLDDIRARLPVSQVVARKVALKRAGREFRGLSPFKVERSPSFFVNDQKGFYHCFASGEHGDIFTFLIKTEGITFPEAVERLAAEAGVAMPKQGPRDEQRESQRDRHYDLMQAAAAFFTGQLHGSGGAEARRYLAKRGLQSETLDDFAFGYAPNSKSALKEHLAAKGFSLDDMIATGMLIAGDDIPVAYDRFRHRVMLPICDLKGRVIAFGGRALEKDVPAKYLNSPETPLFHKGFNLYNAHRARQPAYDRKRLIVVEGYLDVVALAEAGFPESVAPLGTALTEDQVKLLWRMTDEPILCFDGDAAGRKAAFRAVDTVLPHLSPGHSVRFAFLPDGLDPDDLVRQEGTAAMAAVLDRARPLVDVLWEREWQSGDWSTPERRAQLERQLRELMGRISDPGVRQHYEMAVRQQLGNAWAAAASRAAPPSAGRAAGGYAPQASHGRIGADKPRGSGASRAWGRQWREGGPAAGGRPGSGFYPMPQVRSPSLLRSTMVAGTATATPSSREALLLRTLLNHPWLLDDHAEVVAEIPFASQALARLRDAILSAYVTANSLDRTELHSQLTSLSLDKVVDLVERAITHKGDKFSEPDAQPPEVEAGWRHTLAMHERQSGLRRSLAEAEQAFCADGSAESEARIFEIQRRLAQMSDVDAHEGGSR